MTYLHDHNQLKEYFAVSYKHHSPDGAPSNSSEAILNESFTEYPGKESRKLSCELNCRQSMMCTATKSRVLIPDRNRLLHTVDLLPPLPTIGSEKLNLWKTPYPPCDINCRRPSKLTKPSRINYERLLSQNSLFTKESQESSKELLGSENPSYLIRIHSYQ